MLIRFGEKDFDVPEEIILGSGILFQLEEEALAPAHAQIRQSKKGISIRDLGNGVSVDGVTIQKKKWVPINRQSIVLVGKTPLSFPETPSSQPKKIGEFHNPVVKKEYKLVIPCLVVTPLFLFLMASDMPPSDKLFLLVGVGAMYGCFFLDLFFKSLKGDFTKGFFSEKGLVFYRHEKLIGEISYPEVEWQYLRGTFLLVAFGKKYQAKSDSKQDLKSKLENRSKVYVVKPVPYLAPILFGLLAVLVFL